MTDQTYAQPNLLIILSDQLRRQALGCYGDPDARTPHIDHLAQHSVRFANACSTYPICVPFRFTFMTGEYAHTRLVPGIEWAMSPAERTLADEFNDGGYHTAYVGKWHLAGGHGRMGSAAQCGRTPVRPMHQGRWQKWLGFELRNDPFDTYYFEDNDPTPHPLGKYQTDGLFDLGMDHLAHGWDRSSPFCMCISVEPPHNPFVAPPQLQKAWEARDIQLPANFTAPDATTRQRFILDRKRYYAMVENLDQNVGRIRHFLTEQGLAENTILVFVSDHGELNGSHGLGSKQWPYEESVGIPLIVHDPRSPGQKASVLNDPTCTEDLFPTFLGLTGLKPSKPMVGSDLSGLIAGTKKTLDRESVLLEFVSEHRAGATFHDAVWRAVRSRRFKYVVKGDNFGATPWLFFDLENDPEEQHNLLDTPNYQETLSKHHRLLCNHLIASDDPFVLLPAYGCTGVNTWE